MWWDEESRLILGGCKRSDEYFCFCPSDSWKQREAKEKHLGQRLQKQKNTNSAPSDLATQSLLSEKANFLLRSKFNSVVVWGNHV